jgi:hypothetical protein
MDEGVISYGNLQWLNSEEQGRLFDVNYACVREDLVEVTTKIADSVFIEQTDVE